MKEDQWVETNSTGQVLAVTLNGDSIDDVISMTVNNTALDPIKDHLGSVYGWTNANTGTVVQKQSYKAYGDTTIEQSSALFGELGAIRGFASRELDLTTNLYFNRARYYDPSTGRFLSEDPIGVDGGDYNLYRYVKNQPILFRDPSGRDMRIESSGGTDGFVDVGVTVGVGGVVGAAGFQTGSGVTCVYVGGGVGSNGAYLNYFPSGAPSPGGSVCAAGGYGVGGAASVSTGNGSISYGGGVTTPGASVTYTNNFICF